MDGLQFRIHLERRKYVRFGLPVNQWLVDFADSSLVVYLKTDAAFPSNDVGCAECWCLAVKIQYKAHLAIDRYVISAAKDVLKNLILLSYHALVDLYFVVVHKGGRIAYFKCLMDACAFIGGCVLSVLTVVSGAERNILEG